MIKGYEMHAHPLLFHKEYVCTNLLNKLVGKSHIQLNKNKPSTNINPNT